MILNPYISFPSAAYDPDAQAFIDASGITDATQKDAVNNLVLDLKANSLWTKFYGLYPFVGGTASTHKWNLVDPQDTNGAYRLTALGTVTHSSSGVTFNGSSCLISYINPNTIGGSSWHMSLYNLVNTGSGTYYDMGIFRPTPYSETVLIAKYNGATAYGGLGQLVSVGNSDSRGYFNFTTNGTTGYIYKNGSQIATGSSAITLINANIGIGAPINSVTGAIRTGGTYGSVNTQAFASIGTGLNSTEQSNLDTIIDTYQTALGRNV